MHVFMYVLFVKNEGEGEGGRGLIERGAYLRGGLNGCFLVLRKLLFVSFCVVVWVLFSVFSIFCITSLVSATPRNHRLNRGFTVYIFRFMFTSSLPFITHFLYVQGYALIRKFSWILWFIIFFLTEVCLEIRRYKRSLFLNKWPAPFDTCPQVSQTRQKSGLRQEPIRNILARI